MIPDMYLIFWELGTIVILDEPRWKEGNET